jgi:F-box protein 11
LGAAIYGSRYDSAVSMSPARVLTVSQSGQADYRTIAEALKNADSAGTQIRIKPGVYREALIIKEMDVELVGEGNIDEVIIASVNNSPCLIGNCGCIVISNLTMRGGIRDVAVNLENMDDWLSPEDYDYKVEPCSHTTILLLGGSVTIENCEIIPPISTNCKEIYEVEGVGVLSSCNDSDEIGNLRLLKSRIYNPNYGHKTIGIVALYCEVSIESTNIFNNVFNGIFFMSRVIAQSCQIYNSVVSNIITVGCTGIIENCEIFGHGKQTIDIDEIFGYIVQRVDSEAGFPENLSSTEIPTLIEFLRNNYSLEDLLQNDYIVKALISMGIQALASEDNFPSMFISVASFITVRNSQFHSSRGTGILALYEQSTFEECEIFNNKVGVVIDLGARSIFRTCKIHSPCSNPIEAMFAIPTDGYSGLAILNFSNPLIEDCEVSKYNRGIVIVGRSNPVIQRCKVYGNEGGISISQNGQGLIGDCNIFKNQKFGVEVDQISNIIIQRCRIYDGKNGIVIRNGTGMIEGCQVFNHTSSQISLEDRAYFTTIRQCQIYDGKELGVLIESSGHTSIENSDIFGNADSNLLIRDSQITSVRECQIYDSNKYGVEINAENPSVTIESCNLFNNSDGNWHFEDDYPQVRRIRNRENAPNQKRLDKDAGSS